MDTAIKLLVLDDDAVDRLQLKRALKSCGFGYKLTECDDPRSIVDIVQRTAFDCIFLDYMLPGMNGLHLVRKIREAGVKTPIVITTSHGNESIAVDLMKSGASDYVIKNEINSESVSHIIRNALRIREIEKDRELAEKALKISESRLAEAQRIAKIGNWEFDINLNEVYWSPEVYKVFELNPAEFVPTLGNYLNYIASEDRNRVINATKETIEGRPFNVDFQIITPGGVKYANSQGYALMGEGKVTKKIIGTLQDITERKLAEQEIQKARELSENSMKVREIFLANMSHEIRTPMNAILGFTRLLYETNLSDEQKGFIDAIHFSGENLLVIINDILDLSKIQSGKMLIEHCEFNFRELLAGIVSVLKPKATEKGLQLTYKIADYIPVAVKGDPVRLNQVLTNLISNAVKFTEKGGVYLDIDATGVEEKEFMMQLRVRDTGIGIPEDKHAVIFENFVQASSDSTRKYGGTGLGLTIVKNLIELQHGKITLTSKPGYGSTFTVQLPFERAADHGKTSPALASKKTSESYEALRGVRVLVAEDNSVNQLLIRKVLEKVGCKIQIASSGLEALGCLKTEPYDIVLMDIQMPEMDGYEATGLIRLDSQSPYAEIPIIAMTAHAFGSDVNKCISAGMNDYISKPFQAENLYSKMCKQLMKSNASLIGFTRFKNTVSRVSEGAKSHLKKTS
jgi:signal transduction histidine kinase/DNA-binding response OmpR family regulator